MPNFPCEPPAAAVTGDVAVYHAQPHGNTTPLGESVMPQFSIDISSVLDRKSDLLECHESQKQWLDSTQRMSSYVTTMLDLGQQVGKLIGRTGCYEGWRQRVPIGFGSDGWNPLCDALRDYVHETDASTFRQN